MWIGRVNDELKAFIIILDALKKVKNTNWELHVIGEIRGDMPQNLPSNVRMYGLIPRTQVFDLIKNSHLHIITSLAEGNPTTIWEAMSLGIPTLTLDHCGMSGVVCDKCGIKIPILSYSQVINDIAQNIDHLFENPESVEKLSLGVLDCAKKFMWTNRIKLYEDTYKELINQYKKE